MFSQGSFGAVAVAVRRAKRENGGLGDDPPGIIMIYCSVNAVMELYRRQHAVRSEKKGVWRMTGKYDDLSTGP
jgi:hypothetical protein